jgi:ATP-dependent helicase/nuclease subunit A
LRKYADIKAPTPHSDADLKITVAIDENAVIPRPEQKVAETEDYNFDFAKKIKANADYVYPYEPLRYLQAKASVSDIVHRAENDRFAFCEKPAFMLGDKLSGAARGTAMHHVMQFINFSEKVDVDVAIQRLLEWKFITESEAKSADVAAIDVFFKSDLYHRVITSDAVHREMRFLTEISAKSIDKTLDIELDDANIIVQGAVDLCFEERGGMVVLDFKTDRVDNMSELVDCYGEQLKIYSTAAEKIFEKPVKEKIIYSFSLNTEIKL